MSSGEASPQMKHNRIGAVAKQAIETKISNMHRMKTDTRHNWLSDVTPLMLSNKKPSKKRTPSRSNKTMTTLVAGLALQVPHHANQLVVRQSTIAWLCLVAVSETANQTRQMTRPPHRSKDKCIIKASQTASWIAFAFPAVPVNGGAIVLRTRPILPCCYSTMCPIEGGFCGRAARSQPFAAVSTNIGHRVVSQSFAGQTSPTQTEAYH